VYSKGFQLRPLALYWKNHLVKCEIALVRAEGFLTKRQVEKERDGPGKSSAFVRINSGKPGISPKMIFFMRGL